MVKPVHKEVKVVEAEVVEMPGLIARSKAKEQHRADVAARDQRLDAARDRHARTRQREGFIMPITLSA